MLITAAIASLAAVAAAGPASAAPASEGRSTISLGSLGFAADTVDATNSAAVDLNWTGVDRDTAATSIHRTIELRLFDGDKTAGPAKTDSWSPPADGPPGRF